MVPAKEKHNEGNKEPLRDVVQRHFRALVSQLLQGEGVQGEGVQGEANQFNKKPVKTLMFFEGCPRRLCCTVMFSIYNFLLFLLQFEFMLFVLLCSLQFIHNLHSDKAYKVFRAWWGDILSCQFLLLVLLKGACVEELKKIKHVVQYAVFAAYHLSLETSFLPDEGATLSKTTLRHISIIFFYY
ncbi:hypothetical protein ACFX19_025901 [Malus domestica]